MRILVVDDDLGIRRLLAAALAGPGVVVETAEDCPAGLKLLAGDKYDWAIVDYRLPGGSGLDILRVVTDLPQTQAVLISADGADPKLREEALACGAKAVFSKPFSVYALKEKLFNSVPAT